MKIAIVHDYLIQYGGAERVLEAVHEIWPEAPVFTLVHSARRLPDHFRTWDITPTFVQRFPLIDTHYKKYFALFPAAIEQIELDEFDVVLSISSAWAKGIITFPHTIHVSYLLNPMRFGWEEYYSTARRTRRAIYRLGIRLLMNYIRVWDVTSTQRVDHIVAISETTRQRALKYYRRDSQIIYPPCNTAFFTPDQSLRVQDFFLIVSRLKPNKRIDVAVRAFNDLGLPLLIIGTGEMHGELTKIARPNVQFLGHLPDEEIRSHYRRAQAVIFPGIDDFGIVPVEAQSCGTPVIAFDKGGALESVIDGETGHFFHPQTPEALADVIKRFDRSKFHTDTLRKNALRFDKEKFKQELSGFITQKFQECGDPH